MTGIICKVLWVDDEPRILQAYQRGLRRHFDVTVATGCAQALELLAREGPFPVIVADMRMAEMNGIELLVQVKQRAPDTVRVMLTGNADQQTAIDAVNEGDVFRFHTKPCALELVARTLAAAFKQYRLVTAERRILEQTVRGSAATLGDILALVNPEAFGRSTRLQRLVADLGTAMGLPDLWELETAAALSLVGCVALPAQLLSRVAVGAPLSEEERERYAQHPGVGAELLARIPRFEGVAEAIRYQEKSYDGGGPPVGGRKGAEIPLGGRVLKVAIDFDRREREGPGAAESLAALKADPGRYDPKVLVALELIIDAHLPLESRRVALTDLADGMVLNEDIRTGRGILVLCKGQAITPSVRGHLARFLRNEVFPEGMLASVDVASDAARISGIARAANASIRAAG